MGRRTTALELLSDKSTLAGERWMLSDFPATARLLAEHTPGQVVVGDRRRPAEIAELASAWATAPC